MPESAHVAKRSITRSRRHINTERNLREMCPSLPPDQREACTREGGRQSLVAGKNEHDTQIAGILTGADADGARNEILRRSSWRQLPRGVGGAGCAARTAFKLYQTRHSLNSAKSLRAKLHRRVAKAYGSGRRGQRIPYLLMLRDDLKESANNIYELNEVNVPSAPTDEERTQPEDASDRVINRALRRSRQDNVEPPSVNVTRIQHESNSSADALLELRNSANISPASRDGAGSPPAQTPIPIGRSMSWEHAVSPVEKYYTRQTPLKVEPKTSSVRSQLAPQARHRQGVPKNKPHQLEHVVRILSQEYPKLAKDLMLHISYAESLPKDASPCSSDDIHQQVKSENSPREDLSVDLEQNSLLSDQNSPLAILEYLSHAPRQTVKDYLMATRRYFQDKMEKHRREMEESRRSFILCEKKLEGLS